MFGSIIICPLIAALLSMVPSAQAQQAKTAPRIGFLSVNSRAAMSARVEAFQQGLRELGYVEGKDIFVEYRYSDGKPHRLPALAAELVQLKPDVIVTEGPTATRFAKDATSTIPIVMGQDPDPVATGFVASLARPGGNITGLSSLRVELSGKRLELLKKTIPGLAGVAVLGTSTTPGTRQSLRETELAAEALRVQFQYLEVLSPKDIESAFRAATKGRADAVVVLASPFLLSHRTQVADLALKHRLPTIYYTREFVEDGGLMAYGVSVPDLFRRAAAYVDKILKGAKPADLPVEQPTKFELVISLKTANQIGLTIPQEVLFQADKIIK